MAATLSHAWPGFVPTLLARQDDAKGPAAEPAGASIPQLFNCGILANGPFAPTVRPGTEIPQLNNCGILFDGAQDRCSAVVQLWNGSRKAECRGAWGVPGPQAERGGGGAACAGRERAPRPLGAVLVTLTRAGALAARGRGTEHAAPAGCKVPNKQNMWAAAKRCGGPKDGQEQMSCFMTFEGGRLQTAAAKLGRRADEQAPRSRRPRRVWHALCNRQAASSAPISRTRRARCARRLLPSCHLVGPATFILRAGETGPESGRARCRSAAGRPAPGRPPPPRR